MARSSLARLLFRTTTAPQLEPGEHGANSGDCSRRRDVRLTAKRASVEITSISCCDAPTRRSGVGSARELVRKSNVSYAPKPRSRLAGCRACFWCSCGRLYPASMGNVLRRWPLLLRLLMIKPLRPSGWPPFCGTMAGSRVQPASAPRRSGELHPSVGSLPSRPCDWVASTRPCRWEWQQTPGSTRPRGEKAFYVTALRTFSRNALSKPQGSQAHITGEREQASVTCC